MKKDILFIIIALSLAIFIGVKTSDKDHTLGNAPDGVSGILYSMATTTISNVVPTTIFGSTTPCVSRIITTQGAQIMLAGVPLTGTFTPNQTDGQLQQASTTVTYNSGSSSCGPLRAIAVGAASTTITVSEFR